MPIELKVPTVGESITEVQIANWHVGEGDYVATDANVAELETDKATVDLPAPVGGIVKKLLKKKGDTAQIGEVIAIIEEAEAPAKSSKPMTPTGGATSDRAGAASESPPSKGGNGPAASKADQEAGGAVMPAAARLLSEHGLTPDQVTATGPGGRLLKEDVERHISGKGAAPAARPASSGRELAPRATQAFAAPSGNRGEKAVAMSPIRKRIAERLVEAQRNAALLTTFNEIDMSPVMALRKQYQDAFLKRYDVKLGFMSFFVKAVVDALGEIPQVGAQIRGEELVYQNYCDVGIAVGGGKGLVVPIIRNAETLSFAEIELKINDLGKRAKENKIGLDELQGGTFTITNGGIYGSLLSTPIVNPPQSGVLGMHNIVERPVAVNGQVVVRPMMYVALTYDHRVVDGREAVTFLKRIKDAIEDPTRMLIEV
ncbi:MAG: 2-oxoglutarate dehydrogenase complex dihydrolipoyllysine-residue succinyltransferase [Planctomycetota bacterium]|nr:2-oxoglutarate dehydrogenase complex dihydrolipoyllysine-residue succinyltransferase [Planctomycetaceae bacterium]MDQ3330562.1 2-oxoglutarate dehydrogenase complex dihydrolipoyllysine-residue succinyltransferase [Planctomycetota bacterium]